MATTDRSTVGSLAVFVALVLLCTSCWNSSEPTDIATGPTEPTEIPDIPTAEPTEVEPTPEPNDPNDLDGDARTYDNCPTVPNNDQSDVDDDGIGDKCDPDEVTIPMDCGLGDEVTQASNAIGSTLPGDRSGDEENQTICIDESSLTIIQGEVGDLAVVIMGDGFLVVDISASEVGVLRESGYTFAPTNTFVGIDTSDLIEARIIASPDTALDTAVTSYLVDVNPDVLATVPADTIAALPDTTLTQLPTDYWTLLDQDSVAAIGIDRIVTVSPEFEGNFSSGATFELVTPEVSDDG